MHLSFHPDTRCTLELNGATVTLTQAELSALRECLRETGRSPDHALPHDLFRHLFTSGIVVPTELATHAEAAYWQAVLPSVALSPYLRCKVRFQAEQDLPDGIEPAIGLFLRPSFVMVAMQLSDLVRRVLTDGAKSCAVRGIALPQAEMLRLMHDSVADWLASHPESWEWISWQRDANGLLTLALKPGAAARSLSPTYSWVRLIFSVVRDKPHGPPRDVVIPLASLPAVGRIMDALRQGTSTDPKNTDCEDVGVQRVLGAIESTGGFISREEVPPIFACPNDTQVAFSVTHMGHASLIVEAEHRRILIDPWLFSWDDRFDSQPLVASQLGHVDAIFFTHHHADHLDVASLLTLPHDVPIFIPVDAEAPLQPRLGAFLRVIGFTDVRELAHGQSYDCGNSLRIEAVPFFGEGRDRVGFGANCYLISRNGRNVLIHADAAPDSAGQSIVSSCILQHLVRRHGAFDAVWGTWWQERTFACLLSPFLIFSSTLPSSQWLDSTELCDCPPDFLCELMRVSGATHLVSYAERESQLFLPQYVQGPKHEDASQILWRPFSAVREQLWREQHVELMYAVPYLRMVIPNEGPLSYHRPTTTVNNGTE